MSTREEIQSLLDKLPDEELSRILILLRNGLEDFHDYTERLLDEADEFARTNTVYYSREELHRRMKEKYNV